MPKKVSTKQVLTACQMSFDGKSNKEISAELGFTETTVCGWRNTEAWQEFEAELIDAYKQQILRKNYGTEVETAEVETVTPSQRLRLTLTCLEHTDDVCGVESQPMSNKKGQFIFFRMGLFP